MDEASFMMEQAFQETLMDSRQAFAEAINIYPPTAHIDGVDQDMYRVPGLYAPGHSTSKWTEWTLSRKGNLTSPFRQFLS